MRMSDGVEWAVHCCTVLAALPAGKGLTAASLAEFHGVPSAYLAKHLQALTRAGVLEAAPGRGGGYRLAKPAREISICDVVEAVDGSAEAFRCREIRRRGPSAVKASAYGDMCGIARVMKSAETAYRAALAATSIADLVRGLAAEAPPEALAKGAVWLKEELS
ncbi:MAG TPA: Rrf2 family transcriptional regulator [Acidimicrobiales bacterium]|nr:Rrf2 family transcriptional regulator [Acidimicrobiales bacterium]